MKILMVNKFLYPRGGAEKYCLKIGAQLTRMGHEVEYFGMDDQRNVVSNRAGLYAENKDFHQNGLSRLGYPLSILYSWDARRKIERSIELFRPDIIHLNNINFQLTPSVIDGGTAWGVPMVQTVHDPQMLCPNHMMLNGREPGLCQRCVHHSRWSCVRYRCIHGSLAKSIVGALEGTLYEYKRSYDRVARYICPSYFIEQILLKKGRYAGKTLVLPNFVAGCGRVRETPGGDYVLYFGRLTEEKGVDRLLEVCDRLPQVPFVIAGNGPLEQRCKEEKRPNLRFVGFQTEEALGRLIQGAAFSVYLSTLYENCPLSILESQWMGTPVLANRIGGILELVEEGKTGRLIDSFTTEVYTREILSLYQDKAALAQMAQCCREKRSHISSLEEYAEQLLAVYRSVVEEKG